MRVAYLIAGVCCLAFGFGSSPSLAATAAKKKAEQPVFCVFEKKPVCKAGGNSLCVKLNKCGSGCIQWSKCIKA